MIRIGQEKTVAFSRSRSRKTSGEFNVARTLASPATTLINRPILTTWEQRARVSLELGNNWTVKPCEELIAALNELELVKQAGLRY